MASGRPVLRRRLPDLIEATVQRYRTTELRIGASLVHLGHAARLWSPVLACALGHGVVPDLADLQRADDGAQLRMPEPVGEPLKEPPSPEPAVSRSGARPHGTARGRPAGEAGTQPAVRQHRVRTRRSGSGLAVGAARLAPVDHRDHRLPAGHWRAGRIRCDHRRRSELPASQLLLFYRIPGGSLCGDCAL
jgi:hypothetical protein